jgi:hypothetical protein
MLYSASMMNNKPNVPEELVPGKNYSAGADAKVNGWMVVAVMGAGLADAWLHYHPDCPLMWRTVIALIPLPASLLWARSVLRWMRGMDELHRRLTLEACLFATVCTLFIITAGSRLKQTGVLDAVLQATRLNFEQMNFAQYTLAVGLMYCFYFLGQFILNRRYK